MLSGYDVHVTGYTYRVIDLQANETFHLDVFLRTDSSAHIGLFENNISSFANQAFYEIAIGANLNTYIALRKKGLGSPVASKYNSSGFLDESEYRKFWLSWENHVIQIGYGWKQGQDVILSYSDAAPYLVNYIGLGSYSTHTAFYRIYNGKTVC